MLTSSEREKTEDRALFVAQGKRGDALKAMSAAAEDKTEKSLVTPVPLAPARERYGAMRLKSGMPKEAVVAIETTLEKEPSRLGATIGAVRLTRRALLLR